MLCYDSLARLAPPTASTQFSHLAPRLRQESVCRIRFTPALSCGGKPAIRGRAESDNIEFKQRRPKSSDWSKQKASPHRGVNVYELIGFRRFAQSETI